MSSLSEFRLNKFKIWSSFLDRLRDLRRIVHLPKWTETSLITKLDRSGPNHRIISAYAAIADLMKIKGGFRKGQSTCDNIFILQSSQAKGTWSTTRRGT